MNGGVRKRGSTWSYYFDLGKVDGKRKKKEKGGFRTKKDAEAALAKTITEYNNAGTVFEPSEVTVSDYLDQWFDLFCRLNLKYSTQVGYLRIIETHLKPQFGAYRLKAITPAILQEFANRPETAWVFQKSCHRDLNGLSICIGLRYRAAALYQPKPHEVCAVPQDRA